MLWRLSTALAQVKASNTFENLLNKTRQIIYSLHRAKEVTKKVYNNIMNSIKLWYKMDTIVMNSGNSEKSIWPSKTISQSFRQDKLKEKL